MVRIDDNIREILEGLKDLSTNHIDPPAKKASDPEKLFLEKTAHLKNHITEKPTIVLDAGHGFGKDANGITQDLKGTWKKLENGTIVKESEKTLEYTLRAKEMFEAEGCNVIINLGTRDNPLPDRFENRIKTAIDNDAAVFLSIHFNYNKASHLAGPEIYIANNVAAAKGGKSVEHTPLARELGNTLVESMDARAKLFSSQNFIVVSYNNKATPHSNLSHAPTTAAVLVEMGYFSNNDDFNRLNTPEYRDELLGKMVKGTMQYIGQQKQKYQELLAEHMGIQAEPERIKLAAIEPITIKHAMREFSPSIPLEIRLADNDLSFKR